MSGMDVILVFTIYKMKISTKDNLNIQSLIQLIYVIVALQIVISQDVNFLIVIYEELYL